MPTPREIIDDIRRTHYLIDEDLPAKAAQGARNLRATLNRTLQLLSDDLYSTETHFVLELIQNADDNHYPVEVIPEIAFTLERTRLTVTNNELGFTEVNVRALCDAGKSTKKKLEGFIGEKGIGFKSVFTVTDCPEIHSGGFHFRFDASQGYAVPAWISGVPDHPGTRIVLPAKGTGTFAASALGDLSPELLLFLRKLRHLTLQRRDTGATLRVARHDVGNQIWLTTTTTADDFAQSVVSQSAYIAAHHKFSVADISEHRRPEFESTEIVLAFPLNPDSTAFATQTRRVFAYLPIRDFGFSFIVQGDFLLSSSREDIHRSWPWNVRIRDELASAFATALPLLKASKPLATTFLEFVPDLRSITDDFFKEAARQIANQLAGEECVLSFSDTWRKPSGILLANDEFRELFPNHYVYQILGLEYPSAALSGSVRKVLAGLGAIEATLDHVIRLIETITLVEPSPAEWFTALYRYLAARVTTEQWLKKFRTVACLRTLDGKLSALSEVFFPLQRGKRYGFESEFAIIDAAVLDEANEDTPEARKFLERLGVKQASAYSIIRNHILPRHSGDAWKTSDVNALIGHVRYVKDHLRQFQEGCAQAGLDATKAMEQLASGLYVRTRKPTDQFIYYGRPNTLYLCSAYAPPVDLESLLASEADGGSFVNELYLSDAASKENTEDWRTFLYTIGVNRLPTIEPFSSSSSVTDFRAGPHLQKLLGSSDPRTVSVAIQLLDWHWSYYGEFQSTRRYGSTTSSPSAFITALRQLPVPTRRRTTVFLSETYLNSETMRAVFGEAPHYLSMDVTQTDFMDAVGITHRVDAAACFKRLDQLRNATRVSVKAVQHIYRALETRFAVEPENVSWGFRATSRIYIPGQKKWCSLNEIVWESSGEFLDTLYPPLERAYAEHKTFFREMLSVARLPTEEALLAALPALREHHAELVEKQKDAFQIYRRLAAALNRGREADPAFAPGWLDRMRREPLFLDHVGRLIRCDNDLYIDDDFRLAELFKTHQQVSLLPIDRSRTALVQSLLDACAIPTLSVSVTFNLQSVSGPHVDRVLTDRIRARTPAVMRFIFHRDHATYDRAVRRSVWSTLQRLTVQQVRDLAVEAQLAGASAFYSGEIFRNGNMLYVQRDTRSARDKICEELCTLIGAKPEAIDALYRILFAETAAEVDDLLEAKNIPDIPLDEVKQWEREARSLEAEEEEGAQLSAHVPQPSSGEQPEVEQDAPPAAFPETTEMPSSLSTSGGERFPSPRPTPDRARRSGRLLSYAEPAADDSGTSESHTHESTRLEIAAAAVSFVLEQERKNNNSVREMPPGNEGFDIIRTIEPDMEEYIEVKGQSGPWNEAGIVMTPPELRCAERFRARYFLYVVEFALDPARRVLYKIQDPYGQITQFRFDSGWKAVATSLDLIEPAVGMIIDLPQGTGRILTVRRTGQFSSLEVQLGDGPPTAVIYVPGKMRLRRE